MSAGDQRSVGQILIDGRAAQGLTVDAAAARLRLMRRQVEAMEADDFVSLGQPVFARGFVRNYARLLGIAPETLLVRMEGAPAEPEVVLPSEPPLPRSWLTSPWLMLGLLGVALVVLVPVALYMWLNSDADAYPAATASGTIAVAPPGPAAIPAQIQSSNPAPPAIAAAETTATPETEPVAAAVAEAGSPADAKSDPVKGVLHLEFGDESWVEIKDGSGHMLHRQLNLPGSQATIQGQPPFSVVIGNAAQARMTYNDRPIDLKPFIDVTVARFTLEE